MLKKIKNIKWYYWFLIIIVLMFLFKITIGSTFLFSKDGWNKSEREINSTNILISGGGNEPGWNFKVRGSQFDEEIKGFDLITDYGSESWVGMVARTWQKDYSKNFQFRGDIYLLNKDKEMTNKSKNIIIYFEKKDCYDDSGQLFPFTTKLNFNSERDFSGCSK